MEIFTKNSAKCTVFQSTICNKFSSLMYQECWKQLMEYISSKVRAPSQAMSNQPRQSTQIQDRRRCLGRVREWSNTISYMKRCIRTDCQVKDRDSRFNSKIK
jgi:hypothetical protein